MKLSTHTAAVVGGIVLSTFAVGLASAADMPVKAKPRAVAVQAPAWEGFYVGGHAGYGFGVIRTNQAPFDSDFFGSRGFTGGALAGYNHMLSSNLLVGVEGDVGWSDIDHKISSVGAGLDSTFKISQQLSYSARARLGFLLTPETLLYGTAGWARSRFKYSFDFPPDPFFEANSQWFNGVQAGAGIETNLGGNWGARLEYLHTFYEKRTFNSAFFGSFDTQPAVGVGRVALIYRFAQGGGTSWANPEPAPSWTGFYLGGGLGAGAGSTKTELPEIPLTIDGVGVLGILPAALVGANLRVADRWVVGVEGEAAPGVSTTDFELGWLGAVRGRWGYLITPANMIYGTAGWVTTTVKTTSLVSGAIVIPSQRVNALQLGAGVESAVTPNWLVRFDYQYAIADKLDQITVDFGGIPTTAQAHPRWHYGKVAVVYLFGNN